MYQEQVGRTSPSHLSPVSTPELESIHSRFQDLNSSLNELSVDLWNAGIRLYNPPMDVMDGEMAQKASDDTSIVARLSRCLNTYSETLDRLRAFKSHLDAAV